MSLLDEAATAEGGRPNYLNGTGRTLGRISRIEFREATARVPSNAFKVFVEILKSTAPAHVGHKGRQGLANLGFKIVDQDLKTMRECLRTASRIKFGEDNPLEKALKAVADANAAGDAAAAKTAAAAVKAEMERLCGPDQPIVGTPITVVSTEKDKKKSVGKYTIYDFEIPTDGDLDGVSL
jgi:hypothetical protein